MEKIDRKNKGYSLVEVMVAFAILTVGVLPIISMYPSVFKITQRSVELEEKTRIGMNIVSYIKAVGYNALSSSAIQVDAMSGQVGFSQLYTDILPVSGIADGSSNTYTSEAFATKFGYPGFFYLNAKKGINLSQMRFYVAYRMVNIDLVNLDPPRNVIQSGFYRNFITGVVIVGKGTWDGTTHRFVNENNTELQFIVTPME